MEFKLLDRIHEIESVAPISSDEELIAALDRIIEKEEELPWKKRDYDLIEEAIEYKLKLEGVDTEECGRRADELSKKILQKVNKDHKRDTICRSRSRFRRVAFILAAALTLVALTVGTYAFSSSFRDFTNKMYNQLKDKTWYHSDNTDYIITHDTLEFSSLDDLAKDERFGSIALPYGLPDDYIIKNIQVRDYGDTQHIEIAIYKGDQPSYVSIATPSSERYDDLNAKTIGDYDVLVKNDGDYYFGYFMIGNDCACKIKTKSMELLTTVIQSIHRR